MSVTYDPNAPWPLPVLAKFVEVRDLNGYHEIYTNGFVRSHDYETLLSSMGGIKNDWTCRVFMLRVDMENTAGVHLIYNDDYYGKVEIREAFGADVYSLQNNNGTKRNEVLLKNVKQGDIFSFGLRINNYRDIVGCANDKWGPWTGQNGIIKAQDYRFKIWQRTHVLLSMHITQENFHQRPEEVFFPPDYLGLEYSVKPPGSSILACVQLQDPMKE
ncbi:hypothetical protein MTO96_027545 [Rhipicephalus appendiculatus]